MRVSFPKFLVPSCELISGLKWLFIKVTQLVIRILFVFAMVWMAWAMLPLTFKAVTMSIVALSSCILAACFFQSDSIEDSFAISSETS